MAEKKLKIVTDYFGDVTASLWRLYRFYGAPVAFYHVPTEFYLAIDCVLTECSQRAHGVFGVVTAYPQLAHCTYGMPETFVLRLRGVQFDTA